MKTNTLAVVSLALFFGALCEIIAEHAFAPYSAAHAMRAYWSSKLIADRIQGYFEFSYRYEYRDILDRYAMSVRDCGAGTSRIFLDHGIYFVCRISEGFDSAKKIVPEHFVQVSVYAFAERSAAEEFARGTVADMPKSVIYSDSRRIFSTPEKSFNPFSAHAIARS